METRLLQLFLDLSNTGSFSLTAKRHFRTQPAVSIAVRKLESDLGVRLLERNAPRFQLTPEAEALKKNMADILSDIDNLKFEASRLAGRPRGTVKIATINSVGLYELGDTIKAFIRRYPDIHPQLHYEQSREVYTLVENKTVDFGLVAFPIDSPSLETLPLAKDEMAVIAPPDSRFKNRGQISLRELDQETFVAFTEKTPTRRAIDHVLHRAGVRVDIRFEDDNIETIKKAVSVGMGLSIVPLKTVDRKNGAEPLAVLRIKGSPLKRPIGILKLRKYPLTKTADLFVRELLKNASKN